MKLPSKQRGFTAVEFLLIVAVIGIVGFIGYTVYNKTKDNNSDTATTQYDKPIENSEDLKAAEDSLNSQDIDSLDTSELDAAESELL